jgi:hypothetical protein
VIYVVWVTHNKDQDRHFKEFGRKIVLIEGVGMLTGILGALNNAVEELSRELSRGQQRVNKATTKYSGLHSGSLF